MKRKQCQAHVTATNSQCSKQVLRGSRYCWWHQSKGLLFISLFAGAILSLAISEIWRSVVPSQEKKGIEALRKDYSKSLKEPKFSLFLNGQEVFDRSTVGIPVPGDLVSLDFTLQNTGTMMAEHLKMSVKLPKEIPAIDMTGFWREQKVSFATDKTIRLLDDKSYIIEAQGTFAPNDTFGCSPIVIHRRISTPESYPIHTKVAAMKSEPQYIPFTLLLIPGITEPFVVRADIQSVQQSGAGYPPQGVGSPDP